MEHEYLHGRAFVKKSDGKIQIFETPYGLGDFAPVLAEGTTKPRMLKDRFADVVNVRDFGAVGDGVTDDTAAFKRAASAGTVFVPSGSYFVTENVAGNFISDGFVNAYKTGVKNVSVSLPSPSDIVFKFGRDVGADNPAQYDGDPTRWDGVTQGAAYDPFDNILYVFQDNSNTGMSCIAAFTWGNTTESRVKIAQTNRAINAFGHQNNCLYRPCVKEEPVFVCPGKSYDDAGVSVSSYRGQLRFVRWSGWRTGDNGTVETLKTITVLTADDADLEKTTSQCVSFDQRYLVRSFYRPDGSRAIRLWNMLDVEHANDGEDISGKYMSEFPIATGDYDGQGMFCDGNYLYLLRGSTYAFATVYSLDGELLFKDRNVEYYYIRALYPDYTAHNEPEGIFWAPINGEYAAIMLYSMMVYDQNDGADYSRRNRFLAFGKACADLKSAKSVLTNDLNSLVDAGSYMVTKSGATDTDTGTYPMGTNGFVVVERCGLDLRQFYWRKGTTGSNDYQGYTRSMSSSGWGPWYRILALNGNGQFPGNLPIQSSDTGLKAGNWRTQLHLLNNTESPASGEKTGGYFGRYRTTIPGGIRSGVGFGDVLNGTYGVQIEGLADYVDGVVTDSSFKPSPSNVTSLGDASNLWTELYVATATINTSDAREKTSVQDPEEALMRAWGKVNFKVFQLKDAVEKKGVDARLHVGVIAQQVIEAFASEGLDATRYGLLCYDKWEDEYEDVEVVDTPEIVDEEGNVTPAKTHIEHRLITPAGDRYGIRYEEALALEAAYQRWRIDKLEAALVGQGVTV